MAACPWSESAEDGMELDGKVAVVTGPWQFPTTGTLTYLD